MIPPSLILALLAGCPSPTPEEPTPEVGGDTLIIAAESDVGHLLSVISESSFDSDIMENIYFPVIDTEFDCSLKKRPGLASEWSWSEDGKVLSMTLRSDIHFADGTPLTAQDVAFTYWLLADPAVESPYAAYVENMEPDGRPKVIDDHHIEWHFTQAYDRDTQIAHTATIPILPRHLLQEVEPAALKTHPLDKNPVGTGPWKVAAYEPGVRLVLEPNPGFTGPPEYKPHLDRVTFRIIPSYEERIRELQNGGVDLVRQVAVADADTLREQHPEIRLERRQYPSMDYVGWNLHKPLFQDVKVRTALAHAADVDAIISQLLTGSDQTPYARRAVGTVTPALCGLHNDDIVPLQHDLDKARALFAEAGWTDSDGDGLLDKDGQVFQFTLSTNDSNPRREQAAELLESQWEQAGLKVDIRYQSTNAFHASQSAGDFDAAMGGWAASLFADPSALWHCNTPERSYEFNYIDYCNPAVDELIEVVMAAPDLRDTAPPLKEVQALVHADQPYLFLYWIDEIVAVHGRFDNTHVDMLSPINDLHTWSVAPEKVKYPSLSE